jgi:hypothetical protein
MRTTTAGALGGLVAGLIVTGTMVFGRDAGLLEKTLAEDAKDWLDDRFNTRDWAGDDGTEFLEQANHLAASAAFGWLFGVTRPATRLIPPVLAGGLFGAGLYAVAITKIAPLIGLTREAADEPQQVRLERLGIHILFGVITAVCTDALTDRKPRAVEARPAEPAPEPPAMIPPRVKTA